MVDLHSLTIAEMAQKIRNKEILPRELVEAHLQRIEKLQPELNAFAHVDAEGARKQALAVEEALRHGEGGTLPGVPLSLKSNLDVASWPCEVGSLLRKGARPSEDAALVKRLRSAGAVLLGNTTTPEMLMAYETNNRLTGKTSNPWNKGFTPGGSSGGEAAAIAAGCSAGGVGSDGGGSVRVPAHFCGICGLKPTPGRIPANGHYPPGNSAFGWIGVVGPMARSVGDLKILFEVLRGPDPGDALTSPVEIRPKNGHGEKLRIGILEGDGLGQVTPETQMAVRKSAQLLAHAGYELEPIRLKNLERVLELWWFFFGPVIGELFQGEVRGKDALLSPIFKEYLEAASPAGAQKISMLQFVGMCAARDREREMIIKALGEVRVLLSPVCAAPAFRHGEGNYKPGTGYRDTMRHAQWINLAGFCAATVPMAKSPEGLPIGVQIVGQPYEDELVLDVAERLEQERGPWPALV